MSHEVPFVWYDPVSGERTVIGNSVVEADGTFSVVIDDELIVEAIQVTQGPFSFEPTPVKPFWFQEEPAFPEFNVKFDPGKFGINPVPDEVPELRKKEDPS